MPKQRGRPFQRGAPSPNPSGRPPGSKNRATIAAELLLDGEAEAITRKAVELALAGDLTAIRLCFDHIFPLRRGRRICVDLASVNIVEEGPGVLATIVAAAAAGELTLEDAADLSKLVESVIKAKEMSRRLMPLDFSQMSEDQLDQFLVSNGVSVMVPVDTETEAGYRGEQDHFSGPGDQDARSRRSATSEADAAPCDPT